MSVPLFGQQSNCQHHKIANCKKKKNLYFSFLFFTKTLVSLQNPQQSWKQESFKLPEKDVSFYNMAVPPFTFSVLVHLVAVEIRVALFRKAMLGYHGESFCVPGFGEA